MGKNAAIREATRVSSGELVVIFDADMTVGCDDLSRVVRAILAEPASFVYGSRFIDRMATGAMSLYHVLGNRLFAFWLSLLLEQHITDVLCGIKALPRRVLLGSPQSRCRWGDVDMFFAAVDSRLRLTEIPVTYGCRQAGQSKMRVLPAALHISYQCLRRSVSSSFS
jgi:hypothetical protein